MLTTRIHIRYDFCCLNRRQRINLRNRTERLSDELGWATLENNYLTARRMALHRLEPATYEDPKDTTVFKVGDRQQGEK